jgi:predicted HTH domain antitoxin
MFTRYRIFGSKITTSASVRTVQLQIPDGVQIDNREMLTLIAPVLFDKGVLPPGRAAEMAGYIKSTFMEILAHHGVSVFI